jgi:hypothetical protein
MLTCVLGHKRRHQNKMTDVAWRFLLIMVRNLLLKGKTIDLYLYSRIVGRAVISNVTTVVFFKNEPNL